MTLDELCVNTIRFLAVDAVNKAKSGHPGAPMGQAPMGYVLWAEAMRYSHATQRGVDPKPRTPSRKGPTSSGSDSQKRGLSER